jgi:putative phosphoesterase
MNKGVIASPQALEALSQLPCARILAFSDSHGNSAVVKDLLTHFAGSYDALVFCGDGADEVAALWALFPPVTAVVRGNGDFSRSLTLGKQDAALVDCAAFSAATARVFVCHGHQYGVRYGTQTLHDAARSLNARLVFFGHTHIPHQEEAAGCTLINPGSVSMPRGSKPASCALITITGAEISAQFIALKRGLCGIAFEPFTL